MFEKIRSKFQCLDGLGQNSNVWKDKVRIPMFQRITIRITMFGRIGPEFIKLEG